MVYASSVTACYNVKVFFLTVGESCITYKFINDRLNISSFMRTTNIGSIAKHINDYGSSELTLKGLKPSYFTFYQEEGRFKRYQEYKFLTEKVIAKEIKYKGLTTEIEKEENKSYQLRDEVDPYTAALYLFKKSEKHEKGTIGIFYDDKFYRIPWQKIGEYRLQTKLDVLDTIKVMVQPNIKGKGLLQPKGDWYLWIDKKTSLPVLMEVGFIIGSVKVIIEKIDGDKELINSLHF